MPNLLAKLINALNYKHQCTFLPWVAEIILKKSNDIYNDNIVYSTRFSTEKRVEYTILLATWCLTERDDIFRIIMSTRATLIRQTSQYILLRLRKD